MGYGAQKDTGGRPLFDVDFRPQWKKEKGEELRLSNRWDDLGPGSYPPTGKRNEKKKTRPRATKLRP